MVTGAGRTHILTVQSAPVKGVSISISGDLPHETDFTLTPDENDVVTLEAPESVQVGGVDYSFICWFVDSQPQALYEKQVAVPMGTGHTVVAQYDWAWRLEGDVNYDCVVNVLDMIYVRNKLQDHCE